MTGGAQARLRPSLIPLFTRDIKDEKRNEGKREFSSSVPSVFKKFVCPVCLQKSSSVSSVFFHSSLLTLLWVDRLFCETPPVVLNKVLCIKGLYDY